MAQLENGFGATATASGMGAVATVYMALLSQGEHMVSTASVYGPSRVLMEKHMGRFGVQSTFVDTTDLEALKRAIRPATRLVYVESPSNPAMLVTDLRAAAEIAHAAGALLVVDNTFASPYLQKPLDLGADVVLHSVTKFINGHADVVGGVLVAGTEALHKQLRAMVVIMGCCMDPHQASLVSRGLKTLAIRMERAQANTLEIARWLERHPKVEWVRYLGLPSHPQYEPGPAPDGRSRRHAVLRGEGRSGGGGPAHERGETGGPGRVPGRRGDPHLPPRLHDPCQHGPGSAPGRRGGRRSGALFRGHRGPGGSHRGP